MHFWSKILSHVNYLKKKQDKMIFKKKNKIIKTFNYRLNLKAHLKLIKNNK